MHKKLFLSTIVVVMVTLVLSILAIGLVFNRQFDNYLTQTTEATLEQLPDRLGTLYQTYGEWDQKALAALTRSLPMGTELTLSDPQGKVIYQASTAMDKMMNGQQNMMGRSSERIWKTQTYTISGEQGLLGTAVVRYPANGHTLSPQDVGFITDILRSLLLAGGVALILGILLSYWISRRLVTPLQHLTKAAQNIGAGRLDERVPVLSRDEVGKLAQAFNVMADNLTKQEQLRRQFTADVAHELRTPLASIRSYIEAFQDGVLSANEENYAALNQEIDRLVALVSSLKDLNLAEIGALQIEIHPFDLGNLLDGMLHNLQPLLAAKQLTLLWHKPEEPVNVQGDERLLTQLFYNLVHNAYKYTEPGGQIVLELAPDKQAVVVRVTDSGNGISEHDLPLIFERFYRADKSRARQTGGAGIGLALVRQITELHQGTVSVTSTIGQGSVFTVELPRYQDSFQRE